MPRTQTPALPFQPLPTSKDKTKRNRSELPNGEGATKTNQNNGLPNVIVNIQDTQDADLARETLRAVCRDATAPAAAKAQAARTLAEMASALGRHAAPPPPPISKPLSAMTREELEAELARNGG